MVTVDVKSVILTLYIMKNSSIVNGQVPEANGASALILIKLLKLMRQIMVLWVLSIRHNYT